MPFPKDNSCGTDCTGTIFADVEMEDGGANRKEEREQGIEECNMSNALLGLLKEGMSSSLLSSLFFKN